MDFLNPIFASLVNFYNFVVANLTAKNLINFVILYFLILWASFIIWIVKDITNRTTNILLQTFSILIVILLTPIFGLPIYLLIRPRATIFEKYYEEAELNDEAILEKEEESEDVPESTDYGCPKCGKTVSEGFNYCPYCENRLFKECLKCRKKIRSDWKICPYCGHNQNSERTKKDGVKIEVEKVEKAATNE